MPRYVTFFAYTSDSWNRMVDSPGDRTAAIRAVADAVGGTVDSIQWMFGEWDGFVIFDAPRSIDAAALSVAAGSSGALRQVETHELLDQAQLHEVLARAKPARAAFRPPGQ